MVGATVQEGLVEVHSGKGYRVNHSGVEYEVAKSRNCNQDARSLVCIAGGGWQNETVSAV